MPSKLLNEGFFNIPESTKENPQEFIQINDKLGEIGASNEKQVSWLSLFAELDPLSNAAIENSSADGTDRA